MKKKTIVVSNAQEKELEDCWGYYCRDFVRAKGYREAAGKIEESASTLWKALPIKHRCSYPNKVSVKHGIKQLSIRAHWSNKRYFLSRAEHVKFSAERDWYTAVLNVLGNVELSWSCRRLSGKSFEFCKINDVFDEKGALVIFEREDFESLDRTAVLR